MSDAFSVDVSALRDVAAGLNGRADDAGDLVASARQADVPSSSWGLLGADLGLPELYDEVRGRAEAGLVVAPEVDAVAVALECLVANPALRQRLGENARRLTRDRYTAAATARELDSLYRQALTRRANYHA